MRNIDRKIREAEKEYREAKERLQFLYELRDASDLEDEVRPNMSNVRYYGAYYKGIRDALNLIRSDHFSWKKMSLMEFDAMLKLATKSVADADRWMGRKYPIILQATEKDKKGKAKKIEAHWG